jgi:hypothetical protein
VPGRQRRRAWVIIRRTRRCRRRTGDCSVTFVCPARSHGGASDPVARAQRFGLLAAAERLGGHAGGILSPLVVGTIRCRVDGKRCGGHARGEGGRALPADGPCVNPPFRKARQIEKHLRSRGFRHSRQTLTSRAPPGCQEENLAHLIKQLSRASGQGYIAGECAL